MQKVFPCDDVIMHYSHAPFSKVVVVGKTPKSNFPGETILPLGPWYSLRADKKERTIIQPQYTTLKGETLSFWRHFRHCRHRKLSKCLLFTPTFFSVHTSLLTVFVIDQFYKSHNASVPYPTMHHSEQKCAHFCSEWCIVGYGTDALWDLWISSIGPVPVK